MKITTLCDNCEKSFLIPHSVNCDNAIWIAVANCPNCHHRNQRWITIDLSSEPAKQ